MNGQETRQDDGQENGQLYSPENETVLLEAFGRTPELRLIDFFMDNPLFDFTRGEIIEALGMNKRTLYKTLPKLEEMNVVKVSRKIGKAKLYKVNRDSPIVACLRSIVKELSMRDLKGVDEGNEVDKVATRLKEELEGVEVEKIAASIRKEINTKIAKEHPELLTE